MILKNVNTIIVDDEASARATLRSILSEFFPEIKVVGEATSASEAIRLIGSLRPHLCFLDVNMEFGSGFDMLESLSVVDFQVIFVTAHKEEAYRCFRFDVLDYLIKPVRIAELRRAIDKYHNAELNKAPSNFALSSQMQVKKGLGGDQLVIPDANEFYVVEIRDMIRLESARNYTMVYLLSGKKLLATRTIGEFEDLLLGHKFVRIHRSHIINLGAIYKYTKGRNSEVTMKDGTILPIAREKRTDFFSVLSDTGPNET